MSKRPVPGSTDFRSLKPLCYKLFAVGMPVTRHPPHRSQRAALPHWAPASGRNAKALLWIRMINLPIPTCGLTYPLQLMWHAHPALRPEHGLLVRIALGQTSSLHRLRRLRGSRKRLAGVVVRRFRRYYTSVRLPVSVHRWLTSLDFPTRPILPCGSGRHGISRFSREVFLCMQRFSGRARFPYLLP
jgi:hypothetical protein